MAELTVPSRKRRALAELLMSQQPTQPQMVGNQMVYNPTAGLLSGIAQGVGGYLKGQEAEAADNQDKLRREELSKYLSPAQPAQYGDIKFSGGAPELAGIAESGIPSAPVTQPARPASFDYQSAIANALLRGDTESVGTYANASKAFAGGDEYGEAKNIFLPETGKITAAQISKGGNVRQLPFALYQPQNEVFDPLSNRLIKTGGLDPSMVRGYTPLAEQTRTVPLGAEKTPQQKAAEDAAASRVRAEQREERRLAIAEKTAGEKDVERAKKMKGAQVNYEIGERLLNELEAQIKWSLQMLKNRS